MYCVTIRPESEQSDGRDDIQHFAVLSAGLWMLLGVVRLLEDCESISRTTLFQVHVGVHCGEWID
jgi:hypothetical protein